MDITVVVSILSAVCGGFLSSLVTTRRQRKDKQEEREAARDEAYRDQLRHSYAEFISAYSRCLDAGAVLLSIARAMHDLSRAALEEALQHGADEGEADLAFAEAISPALQERAHRAREDFWEVSGDSSTKAVAVLLIDDNEVRREQVLRLDKAELVPPQSADDHDRFHADLLKLRTALHELAAALGGAFSPDRWHREVVERRAMATKSMPMLGTGSAPK